MRADLKNNVIDPKAKRAGEGVDLMGILFLEEGRSMAVRDVDYNGPAVEADELCSGDPVFETLGTQL